MTREEALRLRAAMEQAAPSLDDKTASTAAEMFPALKNDGSLVRAGTRVNWRGVVKRAAVDLWDTIENDPDHAKDLWADILYRDGIRIIPEVITADKAFPKGEEGWWQGVVYISTINNNVWTPVTYPAGWEVKK